LLHASTEPRTGLHLAIAARFHRTARRPAPGNCSTLPQSRPQARTWQLLHASTEPPTGLHLAMAKYPGLGILPIFYLFSGPNFKFNFLLAAVATPLLGMDFLTKFGFSIIPSKQQVFHVASGRTFSTGKYRFFH
jgi:hypothetical protein